MTMKSKNTNTWKINRLLKIQRVNEEIKKEIRKYLETELSKIYGTQQKQF